jgi:hypothetical protein
MKKWSPVLVLLALLSLGAGPCSDRSIGSLDRDGGIGDGSPATDGPVAPDTAPGDTHPGCPGRDEQACAATADCYALRGVALSTHCRDENMTEFAGCVSGGPSGGAAVTWAQQAGTGRVLRFSTTQLPAGWTAIAPPLCPPTGACQVSTDRSPPFMVTFRLRNSGPVPIFLRQGCIGLEYRVASCAGRYGDELQGRFHCACRCDDTSCRGPVACGPCPPDEGIGLGTGATRDLRWAAEWVAEEPRAGYQCLSRTPLPAARYRVGVSVYGSEAAALARTGARTVEKDFGLPLASDLLDLEVAGAAQLPPPTCNPLQTPDGGQPRVVEYLGQVEDGRRIAVTAPDPLLPEAVRLYVGSAGAPGQMIERRVGNATRDPGGVSLRVFFDLDGELAIATFAWNATGPDQGASQLAVGDRTLRLTYMHRPPESSLAALTFYCVTPR